MLAQKPHWQPSPRCLMQKRILRQNMEQQPASWQAMAPSGLCGIGVGAAHDNVTSPTPANNADVSRRSKIGLRGLPQGLLGHDQSEPLTGHCRVQVTWNATSTAALESTVPRSSKRVACPLLSPQLGSSSPVSNIRIQGTSHVPLKSPHQVILHTPHSVALRLRGPCVRCRAPLRASLRPSPGLQAPLVFPSHDHT